LENRERVPLLQKSLKELRNIMQIEDNEEIKIIAKRLKRMLKVGDKALLHGVFWDDLDTLIDLILEEESE
jgi:hypothetical protein